MHTHSFANTSTTILLAVTAAAGCSSLPETSPSADAVRVLAAEDSTAHDAAVPVGQGLIIPAYIDPSDITAWTIIKEGAADMRAGISRAHKDYWVAVNSDHSGPYTTRTQWMNAAEVWDPVRNNGGAIFGYVHTTTTTTGPYFRPIATVEREIDSWVSGYPVIDGIWIDEFYPRFEIAADAPGDGSAAAPPLLLFPNGPDAAPTDRSFITAAGTLNTSVQVKPAGGYYDQLTSYIHTRYPNLRIIGNAGGKLYSDQLLYKNLVDVLCSFEETYAVASADNWAALNRQDPTAGLDAGLDAGTHSELALIHTNAVNMAGAVAEGFLHGYTHVYTTDRMLDANIWGGIPPYFTSEVTFVANLP